MVPWFGGGFGCCCLVVGCWSLVFGGPSSGVWVEVAVGVLLGW